jgi:hypothetical protein
VHIKKVYDSANMSAHHTHESHGDHEHDHHHPRAAVAARPYFERLLEILAEPVWRITGDFERRNAQSDAHHH